MEEKDNTSLDCMDCVNLSKVKKSLSDNDGVAYGFVKVGKFYQIAACKFLMTNEIQEIFNEIGTVMETSMRGECELDENKLKQENQL